MSGFDEFDWDKAPVKQAVAMVAKGTTAEIDALARRYNWKADPIQVMAAILRRDDCPLSTALAIFLRCAPGMSRGDDGSGERKSDLRLAAIIERAVNSGRFNHDPAHPLDDHKQMMIAAYLSPGGESVGDDWGLDAALVAPALDPAALGLRPAPRRGSIVAAAFSSLFRPLRQA